MAFVVTPLFQGANLFIADIEANADADALVAVPHGLGPTAPIVFWTTNLVQAPAELSGWAVQSVSGTDATVVKSVAVGSGVVGAQVRLFVASPHSLFL